ncbi:helix-turn-helix transcriptional regulator [Ralstonia pickettii]|nr:helix-turn-helix transcriptional regulator [Ralstonia pickettii]
MKNIKLGSKLKAIRKSKNYTAMELAEKVNVSQAYISKIENDKASPNLEMLNKVLEAMDSDIYTFFSYNELDTHDDEFIRFYESFKSVKPEVRMKVIELLELIN